MSNCDLTGKELQKNAGNSRTVPSKTDGAKYEKL